MDEDETAIRDLVRRWMDATRAGDVEAVLGLMTDDVLFMVPGRDPFGKEEFAAASRGMHGVRIDGRSDIEEIRILGDWAWIRNRLEVIATPPAGDPIRRAGYTLTILRKEADGRWRLHRDANLLA
jgi:uncharacterized protein (TIGR02246 family)